MDGAARLLRGLLIATLCLLSSLACEAADLRFTVVSVDTEHERLELFLNDDSGAPLKRLDRLASWLRTKNKTLKFAMNAGMFHRDYSPVGLFVQDGVELAPLNQSGGYGNFYLKPNGVFLISASGPHVVETSEYPAMASGVRLATQSGPLLVRRGVIHPAFNAASTSRLIRNGVGVSRNKVFFVISEQPVNFHEFATYFRDSLHCQDALYLDGVVSSLYSVELHRNDFHVDLGPMVGVAQ
jgi:uncharacterized protein YigE (DUF2233 family)